MESDLHLPGFPICGKRHRWDECGGKVVISRTFENESLFSSSACSFHNVRNTKRQQGCRLNTTVIVVIAFEFVFLADSHNWAQTCELCDIRMTRDITAIYRAQCFNEIQSDSNWCFHLTKKLHTPPWGKKKKTTDFSARHMNTKYLIYIHFHIRSNSRDSKYKKQRRSYKF